MGQVDWTTDTGWDNLTTLLKAGVAGARAANPSASPGGQLSFYNDVLSILAQVPHHPGLGLFYWEPEWIPGVGWEPGAGTPNDNLTLFSSTGQALPSVGLFESPLAVCARYDPSALPCEVPDGASTAPSASAAP